MGPEFPEHGGWNTGPRPLTKFFVIMPGNYDWAHPAAPAFNAAGPGFSGLRYRSGPACGVAALRPPCNPLRVSSGLGAGRVNAPRSLRTHNTAQTPQELRAAIMRGFGGGRPPGEGGAGRPRSGLAAGGRLPPS
jgi:hypothetical protein